MIDLITNPNPKIKFVVVVVGFVVVVISINSIQNKINNIDIL